PSRGPCRWSPAPLPPRRPRGRRHRAPRRIRPQDPPHPRRTPGPSGGSPDDSASTVWRPWLASYFSWNSGDAKTTIQRFLSSVAWFSSESVCPESTPSRWVWCALPADGTFFNPPTTAVTKFARASIVFDEIHDSFSGQPPTLGGSNRTWPMPDALPRMSRFTLGSPSAFAAFTMNSVGVLMSARYDWGAVNSGLSMMSRSSVLTSYLVRRKFVARRATYSSDGVGVTKWVSSLRTTKGAVASCARILSSTSSVLHCFVSPRNAYAGPRNARVVL